MDYASWVIFISNTSVIDLLSRFDHAEAEAKHLVGIADDDKDGKLSPEEVIAHYDTFVGSQATDYGEQLHKHDPSDL